MNDLPPVAAFDTAERRIVSQMLARDVNAPLTSSVGRLLDAFAALCGLRQVSDEGAINAIVARVIAANPEQAERYRGGKTALMGFFVGQVMKESGGKANPQLTRAALEAALGG